MSFALWPLLCVVMLFAGALALRRVEGYRQVGPDRRYLDLPPGSLPAPGEVAVEGPSNHVDQPPVRFVPPKCPVGVAGLLLDGAVRGRDLAATLVELQRRGVIAIDSDGKRRDQYLVRRLPGPAVIDIPEEALLAKMFRHGFRGPVDLGDREVFDAVAEAYASAVLRTAIHNRWFAELPDPHDRLTWMLPLIAGGVVSAAEAGLFAVVPAIGPGLVTVGAAHWFTRDRFRRGSRTARGRAVTDQIEGFRTYLTTAEADQLRFEASQDLYERYLPWAVSFDIADRWSAVCRQALKVEELPDFRLPPTWMLQAFFRTPRQMPEEPG